MQKGSKKSHPDCKTYVETMIKKGENVNTDKGVASARKAPKAMSKGDAQGVNGKFTPPLRQVKIRTQDGGWHYATTPEEVDDAVRRA